MRKPGEGPVAPGGEPNNEGLEPEFSIAQSNALAPLLLLFAATVLVVLLVIVRAKPFVPTAGAPADRSFGPADFPALFGGDQGTGGLAGGSGSPTALFPVPAPPFSEGIFPCMDCHGSFAPNPERRPLEAMHSEIVLRHDEQHRWCLDCHDTNDRDKLRLASGALVPFTESYRLCGQCHGTQYRDWREGIHGKRTGYWNGSKRYLLCVHCHNPHSPHFAALQPLPPPIRPQFLRTGGPGHQEEGTAASGARGGDERQKGDTHAGAAH